MQSQKSIGRLSSCITHLSHLYLTTHLTHYGLTSGQLHLLMRLYKQEGINQETLAHNLMLDKTTCARGIQRLESAGFIQKKQDPNDNRAYLLFLTEKAKDLEQNIRKILNNWREIMLTDFSKEEEKQFITYLHRAIANAQKHLKEIHTKD